jgi:hypothetical protein
MVLLARSLRGCVVVVAGLAIAAAVELLRADDSPAATSAAYSTSKNGNTLKWLPYRAAAKAASDENCVTPVTDVEPVATAPQRIPSVTTIDEVPDFPTPNRPVQMPAAAPTQQPRGLQPVPADLPVVRSPIGHVAGPALNSGNTAPSDVLEQRCPDLKFKPLKEVKCDLTPGKGTLPRDCPLVGRPLEPRCWPETCFTWKASCLCHKPLYFEQVQLERYGHSCGSIIGPVLSAGHFFVSIPLLPYNMGVTPPNECLYDLGYYRPGSCSPYMLDPFPLSIRGALFEAIPAGAAAAMFP